MSSKYIDYSSGVDEFEFRPNRNVATDQDFIANEGISIRAVTRSRKSQVTQNKNLDLELLDRFREAVCEGNELEVQRILKDGIDPNVLLKSNWTAVMYAADSGRLEVLELLLSHFANSNSQCDKFTALMACCSSSQREEVTLLATELLLNYGAKVNSQDKLGMTPFLYAARHSHISVLTKLAMNNAKVVNKQNSNGWSALCFSAENGNSGVTLVLLGCGCDATLMTNEGETAADIAERQGHHQVSEILNSYLRKNEVSNPDMPAVLKLPKPSSTQSRISPSILIIITLLLAYLSIIFYLYAFNGVSLNFSTKPPVVDITELDECISSLSESFPNQEANLWKKLSNHIKHKKLRSQTVLCHTIITHESNLNSTNCLLKKIAKCLKISPIIFLQDSKPYTPDQMSDLIRSQLITDSSQFVIFQNTSSFAYPLPVLFHSICDPDYTPYPKSFFYFTFPTNQTFNNEPKNQELVKLVEKTLLESWPNPQYKKEESIASIVRITDVVYHIRNEEKLC